VTDATICGLRWAGSISAIVVMSAIRILRKPHLIVAISGRERWKEIPMDNFTATEIAYKSGYKNGYEQGMKDAVKHGRWVFRNDGRYRQTRCYCTACGKHSGIGGIRENQLKPYCPNCGADMRGMGNE
jgi:hypothetical protein